MKKLIFLIVISLTATFFSGVSASSLDYYLTMDNNDMCRETLVYNIEKNTNNSYLKDILNNQVYFDINNTSLYDKTINRQNNYTVVTLNHDYNCNQIVNSKLINNCFTEVDIDKEKTETYFSATSPFLCTNIADNMSITFETDTNVIDSNALKDGNKYTWDEIDEELYISMEMGKPIEGDSSTFPYTTIIIIVSLAAIIGITTLVVIRKRNNNNNDSFYEE